MENNCSKGLRTPNFYYRHFSLLSSKDINCTFVAFMCVCVFVVFFQRVVFDTPVFHPLVDPVSGELDVRRAFTKWRSVEKEKKHLSYCIDIYLPGIYIFAM